MAKYGPGVSLKHAFDFDREEIANAFAGKIRTGENEEGFIYSPGNKRECLNAILDAYDNAVFQVLNANIAMRTMEKVAKLHNFDYNDYFVDYMRIRSKEMAEDDDYNEFLRERELNDIRN